MTFTQRLCPWPRSKSLSLLFLSTKVSSFQKVPGLKKSTLAKWIFLQCKPRENKQSVLFPIRKGFEVKAFNAFRLSDIHSSAGMCKHTHTHTYTQENTSTHRNASLWSLMLSFRLVSHRSRVSLSYNKLCVHYLWTFWRSEKLTATSLSSEFRKK